MILGHLGEGIPFHLPRIDDTLTPLAGQPAKPVSGYFREHFWITTSGYFYDGPFRLTREMFGDDRLIFSVDYPLADNRRPATGSTASTSRPRCGRRSRTVPSITCSACAEPCWPRSASRRDHDHDAPTEPVTARAGSGNLPARRAAGHPPPRRLAEGARASRADARTSLASDDSAAATGPARVETHARDCQVCVRLRSDTAPQPSVQNGGFVRYWLEILPRSVASSELAITSTVGLSPSPSGRHREWRSRVHNGPAGRFPQVNCPSPE